MKSATKIFYRLVLLLCTGITVILVSLYLYSSFIDPGAGFVGRDEYLKLRKLKAGVTEKEVIQLMGTPHKVVKTLEELKQSIGSFTYDKRHSISNKVFIYYARDIIGYVYINPQGRVEYVFIGGT